MKGCAAEVAWLSSHHISDPSLSPSHDDDAHVVVVAAGEIWLKMGSGQSIRRTLLRFLLLKVDNLLRSSHPPAF